MFDIDFRVSTLSQFGTVFLWTCSKAVWDASALFSQVEMREKYPSNSQSVPCAQLTKKQLAGAQEEKAWC